MHLVGYLYKDQGMAFPKKTELRKKGGDVMQEVPFCVSQ
jgi:hypothetical protein